MPGTFEQREADCSVLFTPYFPILGSYTTTHCGQLGVAGPSRAGDAGRRLRTSRGLRLPSVGYVSTQPRRGMLGTAAVVAILKGVSSLASAGVIILTARALGPAGRGVFALVFTLGTFSMILCGLGISISGRLQLVARPTPVSSRDFFGLGSVLAMLQVLTCAAAAALLLPLFDVRLSAGVVGLVAALGGLLFTSLLLIDVLNAYGFIVGAAVVDLCGSAMQVGLVVGLAAADERGVKWYVAALTAAYGFQTLVGVAYLRRLRVDLRPRFRGAEWRRLLAHGPSGIAVQFGQYSVFKVDRYFVAAFLSPAAVGLYSVAAAFPEMLRVLPLSLSLPVFYGMSSESTSDEAFARARRICLAVMVVAVACAVLLAPLMLRVLFGDEYVGAVSALRLLLVAEVGLALYFIDASALGGQRRVKESAAAVLVGFVVALIGYATLIPRLGINGAAIASVIAYASMGVVAHARLRGRGQAHVAPVAMVSTEIE